MNWRMVNTLTVPKEGEGSSGEGTAYQAKARRLRRTKRKIRRKKVFFFFEVLSSVHPILTALRCVPSEPLVRCVRAFVLPPFSSRRRRV